MNSGLKLYIRLVASVGGLVVLYSLVSLVDVPHPLGWLLFAALAILTASFTIKIASVEASISVDDTFFIASTLLFGPAPATVALAVNSCLLSWRKGHGWHRIAFNTVAPASSLCAGGHAFFLLSGVAPLSVQASAVGPLIPPLLCLTAIYFLTNSGLMAIAVGLESGHSPLFIWRRHFLALSLGYLAAASVGLCLILVVQQVGLLAVALILPVVVIFHLTLRASFGRLEDANRHVTQIDRLYRSTVETLAMAIDAKDDVTHSHVRRVQAYAGALARELAVTDEPTLKAIEAAALLHDTGKLAVPERILNKPGGLTAAEFEEMKRHVEIGANILSLVNFPYPVVPIVHCHHENWDGTGYPRGVAGTDIPIGARILSVVDCFDALTSDRPYRRRLSDEAAIAILLERRGVMYDPVVVDAFIRIRGQVPLVHDVPEAQRDVFAQIARSLQSEPSLPADPVTAAQPLQAGDAMLAFVSLARLASGAVTMSDVLALSTNLVRDLVPGSSGAWFLCAGRGERLAVAEAFGPAASALRGMSLRMGEKLTGWVAANRQVIVNSDAALDLGERAARATPALDSCMAVPLAVGQELVGVLSLYASGPGAFTEDHGRLIQMVAPHLAEALHAARQHAEPAQFQPARELRLVAPRG